jgi:hypothetical protein
MPRDGGEATMQIDQPADPGLTASGEAEWRCHECTILIGQAYQEKYPFRSPLDRRSVVCWRCYESLQRRRDRSAAAEHAESEQG